MKKQTRKTVGIVSASLAIAVAVSAPIAQYVVNANTNTQQTVASAVEETYAVELQGKSQNPYLQYSILPTITSKNFTYDEVKNKEVVLWYNSNNRIEGFNQMTMNVVEYEADGETPKVVNFSSEVATVQNAQIAYLIYCFDANELDKVGRLTDFPYEETKKNTLESGMYDAGFSDTEKANPYNKIVTLSSQNLPAGTLKENLYTKVTYSINDGKEKTVYAHKDVIMKPDTSIPSAYQFNVNVYANVGDTIKYSISIPSVDGDYIETTTATVVE
ncbi:MAG: hypothetical protein E7262_10295 [Lachnospiraceae bacterium]|nr:hypothetical protein [Lachnospiraceae bacterium]